MMLFLNKYVSVSVKAKIIFTTQRKKINVLVKCFKWNVGSNCYDLFPLVHTFCNSLCFVKHGGSHEGCMSL